MQQHAGQISPDGYWMWDGSQWVPNPYRPMAAPPPAAPYESAAPRARIASIFVLSSIAGIALLVLAMSVIDAIPNPNDNQTLVIGLLSLVAFLAWLGTLVAAVVFYCMWLHRVIRNMPAIGAPDPRWSPPRSVVYCFIPFVSLVHPLWSVLDAWRGADSSRRWLDRPSRKALGTPQVIVGWWATWLIGSYVLNVGSRLNGGAAVALDIIGGVIQIGAAVLCVMVIRDVTARQERKNQLIANGQLV